jgi:hypothetical protein
MRERADSAAGSSIEGRLNIDADGGLWLDIGDERVRVSVDWSATEDLLDRPLVYRQVDRVRGRLRIAPQIEQPDRLRKQQPGREFPKGMVRATKRAGGGEETEAKARRLMRPSGSDARFIIKAERRGRVDNGATRWRCVQCYRKRSYLYFATAHDVVCCDCVGLAPKMSVRDTPTAGSPGLGKRR